MIVCVVSPPATRSTLRTCLGPTSYGIFKSGSLINQEGLCVEPVQPPASVRGGRYTCGGHGGGGGHRHTFTGRADPFLIYRPRFIRLARNSNSRGFARQTIIIRCGQTSADTKVSTQTRFSAYSEVSIALLIFMHDYSERRGQLRWRASDVARCARQQNENG